MINESRELLGSDLFILGHKACSKSKAINNKKIYAAYKSGHAYILFWENFVHLRIGTGQLLQTGAGCTI